MQYIKNPELNLIIAPYKEDLHIKFDNIECRNNVLFYAESFEELNELYLLLEQKLNTSDLDSFILNNKKFIYKGKNNYHIEHFEGFANKEIWIGLTNSFDTTELIFENGEFIEKNIIKLSEFNYKSIELHKGEIVNSGIIDTNNKLTYFTWSINNIERFEKIYYEVSLWKNNKILKLFNTNKNEFVFAEHALKENDGYFELLVVAKDVNGSTSLPASYRFNLKTKIVDDFKITIINEFEEESNVSNLNSPKFKITPYEEGYDYRIYLNNQVYSYLESTEQQKEYFQIDKIKNCMYFYCPEILSDGRYLLNMEKIDNVGNKTGNYINPLGKHGTTFLSFVICTVFLPAPEIIDFYWINNNKVFLNWKSNESAKNYKVFQNSTLLADSEKTFIEISPIQEEGKDLIIDIYSYDYMGKRSEEPCKITLKKYSEVINFIDIKKESFVYENNTYYTNNPNPLFQWEIPDSSKLKYYKVSLDGSNWFSTVDNKFMFNTFLLNSSYTFRVQAINENEIPGIINTFTFNLQNNKTAIPVFDRATITLKPSVIDDIKISWLEIKNVFKYRIVFNETLITENTPYKETFDLFIELKNCTDLVKVGINTINVQSVDIFGNSSDYASLSFTVLPNSLSQTKPAVRNSFFVDQSENNDNKTFTWSIQKPEGATFCKLFLVDPKDIDREIIDRFEGDQYTNNNVNFDIDGTWYIELEWYKQVNDTKFIALNKTDKLYHIYNSFFFDITNFQINENVLTWSTTKESNYNYFNYSIAPIGSEFLNYTKSYSKQLDLNNKVLNGNYKINIIGYSINNLETVNKEFTFEITQDYNYEEKEIFLNEYLKAKIKLFKNKNIFQFIEIKDLNENKKQGVLMYKKAQEEDFKFYSKEVFLETKKNYNFIFNEVLTENE